MNKYHIHGLNILSSVLLKGKEDFFDHCHLKIEWLHQRLWRPSICHSHDLINSEKESVAQIHKYKNGALSIDYFHCGFFYLNGHTLLIAKETFDDEFFDAVLTTQILPLVASTFYTTLHGGAVTQNKSGIAFLAPEGFGKSTLTTHLQNKGLNVCSDDVISLEWKGEKAIIHRGCPEIRLNKDSADEFMLPQESSIRKLAKWSFAINDFINNETQLHSIFILNPQSQSEECKNTILSPQQALPHLLINQFRLDIWGKSVLEREFKDITKLLKSVQVRELRYPFEYSSLEWLEKQIRQGLFNDSQIHTSP